MRACFVITYIIKAVASCFKEHTVRIARLAWLQAHHPNLKFHYTADAHVKGQLIVKGRVIIGPQSRIDVESGGTLVFGGRNIILGNVIIGVTTRIEIMEDVSIQDNCTILGDVIINRGSLLAPRVFISSGTHQFKGSREKFLPPWLPIRMQDALIPATGKAVVIGKDCWIGINSCFMPGSSIKEGCIIGANSVVTGQQSVCYGIYAGCPAKLIGHRWLTASRQILPG